MRALAYLILGYLLAAIAPIVMTPTADAAQPLDSYASLPDVAYASLSPDGKYLALTRPYKGKLSAFFYSVDNPGDPKVIPNTDGDIDMRNYQWLGPKHIVFTLSRTTKSGRELIVIKRLAAYNIETGKFATLMSKGASEVVKTNYQITNVISTLPEEPDTILMGAYVFDTASNRLGLQSRLGNSDTGFRLRTFRVDLNSGKAKPEELTHKNTFDVIVDTNGDIVARYDYDNDLKKYALFARKNGKWDKITEIKGTSRTFNLQGVGQSPNSVVISRYGSNNFRELAELSLDSGTIGKTLFSSSKYDFDHNLTDPKSQKIVGVNIPEDVSKNIYFDRDLKQWQAELAATFAGQSVQLTDWNNDRSRFLVYVEGGGSAGEYHLFKTSDMSLSKLGSSYPSLKKSDIAKTISFDTMASDGKKIPGYLTLPVGKLRSQGPFPTVVLPHGGPESRDDASFDYWAQFLASRGYAVYKPNFRGSSGYGASHRNAGYGEWGGKMIDDIVDGTKSLKTQNIAHAERLCIMGGSYGGYAALAASVRAPDLYKCAISINGVTNVGEFFSWNIDNYGKSSQSSNYWRDYIGRDNLTALPGTKRVLSQWSPAKMANQIKSSVLIMHGDKDDRVPYEQFKFMKSALSKTNIEHKAITMKGNDHFLRSSESRKQFLSAAESFLHQNIGQ